MQKEANLVAQKVGSMVDKKAAVLADLTAEKTAVKSARRWAEQRAAQRVDLMAA